MSIKTINGTAYAFILGRNPTLSIAEITNMIDNLGINYTINDVSQEALILNLDADIINWKEVIGRVGGTIKIAEIISENKKIWDIKNIIDIENICLNGNKLNEYSSKKIFLGISVYFLFEEQNVIKGKIAKEIQRILFEEKKKLSKKGLASRIVAPPFGKISLDSAAVFNNKLLSRGAELIVLIGKNKIYLAKTLCIQDFKSYGMRDYGRPYRDMKIGMMPPKLAQIMLNLAQVKNGDTILDPFCGTGVVLQEAILLGYKAIGCDINDKMLEYSDQNLKWLQIKYNLKNTDYKLFKREAQTVSKLLANNSIGGIVTEGTLGPKYGSKPPSADEVWRNFKQLEFLYIKAFGEFKKILKAGGKIAITLPFYRLNRQKNVLAPFIDKILAEGYNILCPIKDKELLKNPVIRITERNTILYDRPDQIVGREILIFKNL